MYMITEQEFYSPTTGARRVLRAGLIAVILDLTTIHDKLQPITNGQFHPLASFKLCVEMRSAARGGPASMTEHTKQQQGTQQHRSTSSSSRAGKQSSRAAAEEKKRAVAAEAPKKDK